MLSMHVTAGGEWRAGKVVPLSWLQRERKAVNTWKSVPRNDLVQNYMWKAVAGRMAQLVGAEMQCKFAPIGTFLQTIACACGVNRDASVCSTMDINPTLGERELTCGVATAVAGVDIPATANCQQNPSVKIQAAAVQASEGSTSAGRQASSRTLAQYREVMAAAQGSVSKSWLSRRFSAAPQAATASACYAKVKNSLGAIIGQLRGDCLVFSTTTQLSNVRICMTIKASVEWDSTAYPIAGLAFASRDANNQVVYTAQSNTVTVDGTQMCVTVNTAGGTFCPVSLRTSWSTISSANPGTCAGSTLVSEILQVETTLQAGATKLGFVVQPATTTASGTVIAPSIQVAFQNAAGNTVTGASASISLDILSGTGATGASVTGTAVQSATAGIATFDDISIDKAGSDFKLVATSGALSSAVSAVFAITPGAPVAVAFDLQPAGCVINAACLVQPRVRIVDINGNTVTSSTATVVLTLKKGSVTVSGLSGTASVAAVSGVATFSALSLTVQDTGYTLVASSGALGTSTSVAFNAVPASGFPVKLGFAAQPAGAERDVAFTTQPLVEVQDSLGVKVASAADTVTLKLNVPVTASSGAALSGTAAVVSVSGVATYTGLKVNRASLGYSLTATADGLAPATSSDFTVNGIKDLVFSTQPAGARASALLSSQPKVAIRDVNGNVMTNRTDSITVTVKSGSGTAGAGLVGTVRASAVAGVATFSDIRVDTAGSSFQLVAMTDDGIFGESTAFHITSATSAAGAHVASMALVLMATLLGLLAGGLLV